MTTQWTTKSIPGSSASTDQETDKFFVLLLYGKNSFGDKIYSYLRITLEGMDNQREAIRAGKGFNPNDFGTVIAAGRGEPTDDVRREIASTYEVLDNRQPPKAAPAEIPPGKKAWDEY